MVNLDEQWVGKGIKYPEIFDKRSGSCKVSTNLERINQSIYMILSTPIGTRFFLPAFGSKINEALFEPNDFILQDMLEMYVNDALSIWEPRITVLKVDARVNEDSNEVPIYIYYKLINSNITNNYVYPFKRQVMELQ